MFKDDQYKVLNSIEGMGPTGFGIKILIASRPEVDLSDSKLRDLGYTVMESLKVEIQSQQFISDPKAKDDIAKQRFDLLTAFPEPIYVKNIPNGYSNDWYFQHFPWLEVTTKIGTFVIGWRKRVISLDWSGTECLKTADELFPGENTTKSDRLIHAWSYTSAKKYVATVMESVKP